MMNSNAQELYLQMLTSAGINPATKLPIKLDDNLELKKSIKKSFRIVDEQDAINRYVWHNLPSGINSQMLERILYYKGSCIIFYLQQMGKFYCLPYTLDGNIDCYGRYMGVTPVTFSGGKTEDSKGKPKPWIPGLTFEPEYDILLPESWDPNKMKYSCVILNDYTPQIAQNIIPRYELQEPLIDLMSDTVCFSRTALQNSTGVSGVRCGNEDEQTNITMANNQIKSAALTGASLIPIFGKLDFQMLSGGNTINGEEFLLNLQALDNLRLSHLGLSTGGLFQKRSHMLEAEQNMNAGHASLVLQDGLTQRQSACDILNSIFGIGTWVEPSESVLNIDKDLNGEILNNTDNSVQAQAQNINMESEVESE